MRLSIVSIDKLRNLGLRLSDEPSFGADHLAYPLGYTVMKPIGVGGNSVPSLRQCYEAGYTPDDSDAPVPVVWNNGESWCVCVRDWVPGPGPGDFLKKFVDEAAAVQFIVQYFFDETREFTELLAHENQKRSG